MADSLKSTLLAVQEGRISLTEAMKLLQPSSSPAGASNRVTAIKEGRLGLTGRIKRSKGGLVRGPYS